MKINHRLTQQELSLAKERLGRVRLYGVNARSVTGDVVEIDAQINLLPLIINLTRSGSDHRLAIVSERSLIAVGKQYSLRILYTDVHPDGTLRSQIILNQAQRSQQPDDPATAVSNLVRTVVSGHTQTPRLDHGTSRNLSGETLDLTLQLSVLGTARRGLLTSCGSVGCELVVQSIKGINLDDVVTHDTPQSSELFLVLAHLGSVRGLRLLDPLNQLVDLLPGGIQLAIDGLIFRGKAVVVPLEGYHLLGKVLLLGVKVFNEGRLGCPNIGETSGHESGHGDKRPHNILQTLVFLLLLFALAALQDGINFRHIIEFLVQLAKLTKLFLFRIFVHIAKIEQNMRYLIRSLKYFIWFALILSITLAIMVGLGLVETDPNLMFRDGIKSIWQIAALFLILALVYPIVGFRKQEAVVSGEYPEVREKVINFMESRGYYLETEEGEIMTFRLRSKVGAFFKMLEDRVTFIKVPGGFEVEGLRKEIVRLISGLEYLFRNEANDNYSKY